MPEGINLLDLFNTASKAIQQNKESLNKADSYNGNHGDNMVEIFDVITQAMKEKKSADAPTQLEYAAQLLRNKSQSGSANVFANGLAEAAKEVTGGGKLDLGSALGVLTTVLNGGQGGSNASASSDLLGSLVSGLAGGDSGSALGSLVSSLTGGDSEKKDDGPDWLSLGMNLLQGAQASGLDLGELASSLVSGTEMGKSEHRSQSGQLITNAVLQMLMSQMSK